MAKPKKNNKSEEPIEKQPWKAADKLRKNIDAAEYKQCRRERAFTKTDFVAEFAETNIH